MACSCGLKNANMPGDFKHDLPAGAGAPGHRPGCVRRAWLALFLTAAVTGFAAEPPAYRHVAPLPAIRQAAAAAGLACEGLPPPAAREKMAPGDGVTVLVSLSKGAKLQQWLIDLAMAEPRAGDPLRTPNSARLYTSTGREFRFDGGSATIALAMLGPLAADAAGRKAATAPEVRRLRTHVSADYLALGLERVPAMMVAMRARRQREPNLPRGAMSIADQPFPAEVVARDAKTAGVLGGTAADERAAIGSMLALQEFLQLASRTPGIQDVLMSVLDIPWWAIIRSGGKLNFNLEGLPMERELSPADWGLPASEKVYSSPFLLSINGKPALLFQLALVAPKPPLTVCAGIIGLAAGAPDGTGPVLTFQVVAARTHP